MKTEIYIDTIDSVHIKLSSNNELFLHNGVSNITKLRIRSRETGFFMLQRERVSFTETTDCVLESYWFERKVFTALLRIDKISSSLYSQRCESCYSKTLNLLNKE